MITNSWRSSFSVPGTLGRALQAFYLEMEEWREDAMGEENFRPLPIPEHHCPFPLLAYHLSS